MTTAQLQLEQFIPLYEPAHNTVDMPVDHEPSPPQEPQKMTQKEWILSCLETMDSVPTDMFKGQYNARIKELREELGPRGYFIDSFKVKEGGRWRNYFRLERTKVKTHVMGTRT